MPPTSFSDATVATTTVISSPVESSSSVLSEALHPITSPDHRAGRILLSNIRARSRSRSPVKRFGFRRTMVSTYDAERDDERPPRRNSVTQEPVNYNHLSHTGSSYDLHGYVKPNNAAADHPSPGGSQRSVGGESNASGSSARSSVSGASGSSRPTSRQSMNSIALNGRNEPWALQFERLRDRLEGAQSRDEKLAAMGAFVQSLPPFYAEAARYMVASGKPVNVDSLYHYFRKLDKTSSAAAASTSPSSSRRSSSTPSDARPLARTRKVGALEPEFGGFSPSRPQIANLLVEEREELAKRDKRVRKDVPTSAALPTSKSDALETDGGIETTPA